MNTADRRSLKVVAALRITLGTVVVAVIGYAYSLRIAVGDSNPFDYFGYFTNQMSTLAALMFIGTGVFALGGGKVPRWLPLLRGISVTCLMVVAVIYNALVPGNGTSPTTPQHSNACIS